VNKDPRLKSKNFMSGICTPRPVQPKSDLRALPSQCLSSPPLRRNPKEFIQTAIALSYIISLVIGHAKDVAGQDRLWMSAGCALLWT
jgi:hypothetical protein